MSGFGGCGVGYEGASPNRNRLTRTRQRAVTQRAVKHRHAAPVECHPPRASPGSSTMFSFRAVLLAALLHVASGQSCKAGEGTTAHPGLRARAACRLGREHHNTHFGLFPPFTSGLKINARTAGNACPGNGNIVMSGFTAATDTTLNGIYSRVPTTLMKCRNVAGTLTDGTDSANTAGCAPYCQNRGASAKDKCIGDGGRE